MAARIRYTTFRPKVANRPGSASRPSILTAVPEHPEGVDPGRVRRSGRAADAQNHQRAARQRGDKARRQQRLVLVTTAEARLAARTPPRPSGQPAASRGGSSTTTPGASPAHRPSSAENSQPICPGFSCHSLASCAATAGAVIRIPGAIAAKSRSPPANAGHHQPGGPESALSVRGVLDIVGRAPVKASPEDPPE